MWPRAATHNMCLSLMVFNYECGVFDCVIGSLTDKRSCRHVKDPVVCVIVWWITETHRYPMHISVNMYCTSNSSL